MKNTGRGAIRLTRLFRFGGAAWLEKSNRSRGDHERSRDLAPLAGAGPDEVLAKRAGAGAVGDDRPETVGFGGGLEERLAADGEADAADPVAVHVGTPLEEGDGGVEVFVRCPAEGVRVAVAFPLAAAVEEQDAVAVADEYPRRLL